MVWSLLLWREELTAAAEEEGEVSPQRKRENMFCLLFLIVFLHMPIRNVENIFG